jgi:hypothetical protein
MSGRVRRRMRITVPAVRWVVGRKHGAIEADNSGCCFALAAKRFSSRLQ